MGETRRRPHPSSVCLCVCVKSDGNKDNMCDGVEKFFFKAGFRNGDNSYNIWRLHEINPETVGVVQVTELI